MTNGMKKFLFAAALGVIGYGAQAETQWSVRPPLLPTANTTPISMTYTAPISMTKMPQRGGRLYQVDITSLVDDLTITGAELNRGNCVSYILTKKASPGATEGPVEAIIKEGTVLSQITTEIFARINATKVGSISLKFSQTASILYEGSCNVLEAKVDTDQGTWIARFNQ